MIMEPRVRLCSAVAWQDGRRPRRGRELERMLRDCHRARARLCCAGVFGCRAA